MISSKKFIPTESAVVEAYTSGELLHVIFDFDSPDSDDFIDLCVRLHNDGRINLFELSQSERLDSIEGFRFFTGQHFFCKAIPKLNAPIEEMMKAVTNLVEKGGADLAANYPNGSFRDWCRADLNRANEVVKRAKADDALALKLLTFALEAGNMIEQAGSIVTSYTDSRRISAIAALGRMTYINESDAKIALKSLRIAIESGRDDLLVSNVLMSTLSILEKSGRAIRDEASSIVRDSCTASGPQSLFFCARALWLYTKVIDAELVTLLLDNLHSVDPSHTGTIGEIDRGLSHLLDTAHADQGIDFLAKLLRSTHGAISLSQFPSSSRRLLGEHDKFHRVVITWLLSADRELCEGIAWLARERGDQSTPLDVDVASFNLSPAQQIFICKKAIGYLFMTPVAATSMLVSVLRNCTEDVASHLRKLLFDPLLLNYGGAVSGYLDQIPESDPAHTNVQVAIAEGKAYLDQLRSVGDIKELLPSENERQIERFRFHETMQSAQKEAEKKSVFLNLVTRSVLLYGRRSLTYVQGPDNQRKPMGIDLKSFSTSIEFPRMEMVDPVGLDYMLRLFRAERLRT